MKKILRGWGAALAAALPLMATAQAGDSPPPKPNPRLVYRSAFADYKPYADAPPADWRALNAAVAGAMSGSGGHAGHGMGSAKGMAKLATPAVPVPPASRANSAMPMMPMPNHDGHHKEGGKP